MAGISTAAAKDMLDWNLGGAVPTRPSSWSVGLSLGSPSAISASELATGSGANRVSLSMAAATAGSPATATNATAMTFGPFSGACTVSGLQIWNTSGATGGVMQWYGLLATARTMGVGDSLVFNTNSLVCTLT